MVLTGLSFGVDNGSYFKIMVYKCSSCGNIREVGENLNV